MSARPGKAARRIRRPRRCLIGISTVIAEPPDRSDSTLSAKSISASKQPGKARVSFLSLNLLLEERSEITETEEPTMPWDPLSTWPNERRWIWLTIAGWLLLLRGPAFVENLHAQSPQELIPDFF
jgi:hypothetical protein